MNRFKVIALRDGQEVEKTGPLPYLKCQWLRLLLQFKERQAELMVVDAVPFGYWAPDYVLMRLEWRDRLYSIGGPYPDKELWNKGWSARFIRKFGRVYLHEVIPPELPAIEKKVLTEFDAIRRLMRSPSCKPKTREIIEVACFNLSKYGLLRLRPDDRYEVTDFGRLAIRASQKESSTP